MQVRSQLLPLLRSPLLAELLAWLFLHPEDEFSLTELATRFAVSQSTLSREADRLVGSELVHEARRGRLRLLRANPDTLLGKPLTDLLALTYGPSAVLADLLSAVPGVAAAYIYGSWAARYKGQPGPIPRDIDVLVIGSADEDDLFAAAREAEQRLGREVNIHRTTHRAWQRGDSDPFLKSVRSRPLVPLDLDGETRHEVATGARGGRRDAVEG